MSEARSARLRPATTRGGPIRAATSFWGSSLWRARGRRYPPAAAPPSAPLSRGRPRRATPPDRHHLLSVWVTKRSLGTEARLQGEVVLDDAVCAPPRCALAVLVGCAFSSLGPSVGAQRVWPPQSAGQGLGVQALFHFRGLPTERRRAVCCPESRPLRPRRTRDTRAAVALHDITGTASREPT